ncbi:MAG TPA: type II secretion system secretin GspD [Polyangiaceae bacterium]
MRFSHRGTLTILSCTLWAAGFSFALPAAGQAPPPAAPAPGAQPRDPEPPGAAGPLPTTMDKIAAATDIPFEPKPPGYRVKFNLQDADLAELVNHISGMTGRRFIYGAKVRQIKATVVSPQPVTLDEAYEAFLSILEVNGMTVVPHGRFLKIVDSAGVNMQSTPIYSRGAPVPDTDRYITRLYRLEHVSAEEVAAVLAKFKSKEGDISIHSAGQLLIITDTGTQVRRMIRIVEEIDVGGAGQHMWIEPVNYGAAEELAQRINELFELGGKAGQPGASASGLNKVIADDQTNSLIVVGTEDSYLKLLEVLKRLDARPGETGRVHVLPLQHAVAEELAGTLSQMLSGQRSSGKAKKGDAGSATGDAGGMFEGDVQVTADVATNSLVITSSGRDYAQLRLVIDKLDRPRRQVFIEAVIMDIGVSDDNTLGFAFHGGSQQDLGGDGDSLILGGFDAGRSTAFPLDASLMGGFAAGIRGPDLPGTNNLLGNGLSIPAFGVVMNAIAESGRGNILATPHIIATDNVPAEIEVGENVPTQVNAGGGIANLAGLAGGAQGNNGLAAASLLGGFGGLGGAAPRADVGNRIKITPHVNESSQVRLELELESSAAGAPQGALGAVPITQRMTTTTLVVKDQQTVVIGGLTREEYVTARTKVPVLGDLPVLGFLFRSSTSKKRKTNLLLVLTPHVVREQGDLRRIFERKMRERQEFLDRYFVFATDTWEPPTDYSRANGLVEEIRQAQLEWTENKRLELESKPTDTLEHQPSDPIALPVDVAGAAGQPQRAPTPAPAAPAPAAPAPAKKKGTGRPKKTENDLDSIRIAPVARSVLVERSVLPERSVLEQGAGGEPSAPAERNAGPE